MISFFLYLFISVMYVFAIFNPLFSLFGLLLVSFYCFYMCFFFSSFKIMSFMVILCLVGGIVIVFSFVVMEIVSFFGFSSLSGFFLFVFMFVPFYLSNSVSFGDFFFGFKVPLVSEFVVFFFVNYFLFYISLSVSLLNKKMKKI